jgi:hypothetical protein
VELPAAEKHTHVQILKSSVVIDGSSALNIAIGIVRTKAMASLLGPAGFGLMGLYGSIADVAVAIGGMGVNSSGVRQIGEAGGSSGDKRIARTVTVLRRTTVLLRILGAVVLVVFCRQGWTAGPRPRRVHHYQKSRRTYPIVRALSGFRWSHANRKIGMLFLCSITLVFCGGS